MVGDILQPTHLLFVLIVALLVLGPKRLPEVARTLGNGIRDFRSAISGEETSSVNDGPQTTRLPSDYNPEPPVPPPPVTPEAHEASPLSTDPEPAPEVHEPEPQVHEPEPHQPELEQQPPEPVPHQPTGETSEPPTQALPAEPPATEHSEAATTEQRPA